MSQLLAVLGEALVVGEGVLEVLVVVVFKLFTDTIEAGAELLTSYSEDNLVVDATAFAVNDLQIQQENKYQCVYRRKQMIMQ
jgi:hypothetical protein